jgi:hypothetical protein
VNPTCRTAGWPKGCRKIKKERWERKKERKKTLERKNKRNKKKEKRNDIEGEKERKIKNKEFKVYYLNVLI